MVAANRQLAGLDRIEQTLMVVESASLRLVPSAATVADQHVVLAQLHVQIKKCLGNNLVLRLMGLPVPVVAFDQRLAR